MGKEKVFGNKCLSVSSYNGILDFQIKKASNRKMLPFRFAKCKDAKKVYSDSKISLIIFLVWLNHTWATYESENVFPTDFQNIKPTIK